MINTLFKYAWLGATFCWRNNALIKRIQSFGMGKMVVGHVDQFGTVTAVTGDLIHVNWCFALVKGYSAIGDGTMRGPNNKPYPVFYIRLRDIKYVNKCAEQ